MEKFIVIKIENKYKKVFVNNILYCRADGSYTKFFFKDKKELLCAIIIKRSRKGIRKW
jgi:DNA-binding LytR/AlgR family response regulator